MTGSNSVLDANEVWFSPGQMSWYAIYDFLVLKMEPNWYVWGFYTILISCN